MPHSVIYLAFCKAKKKINKLLIYLLQLIYSLLAVFVVRLCRQVADTFLIDFIVVANISLSSRNYIYRTECKSSALVARKLGKRQQKMHYLTFVFFLKKFPSEI